MLHNFCNILDNTDSILWFPRPLPAIGRPPAATTHRHADDDLQSYLCNKTTSAIFMQKKHTVNTHKIT